MSDDDLEYLHSILLNMDGEEEIRVGIFIFTAAEFFSVTSDALQARGLGRVAPG